MDDDIVAPLSTATPRPSGGPPWQRTLYACWVAQFLSIVGFSFVMPFIPFYVRFLGVDTEAKVAIWSGLLVTASGLMGAVFAPIWGGLADRYGRKMMVQRAMFGGAVVMALSGFAADVQQLLVLRLVQGALTGTVVASTTLVAAITPKNRMGFSLDLQAIHRHHHRAVDGGAVADAGASARPRGGGALPGRGDCPVRRLLRTFLRPGRTERQPRLAAFGRRGPPARLLLHDQPGFQLHGAIFPLLIE